MLIRQLIAIPGIQDLALTTNAVLLAELAQPLYDAGLRRINVHLDTLDRERFKQITRRDDLDKVLESMPACELGYGPIKLNAVAVKGLTEPDVVPIARFCRENGIEPRFIEFMPLDAQHLWDRNKVLLADDMIATLSREISPLIEIPDRDPRAPATEYRFADGGGRVGFIASVTRAVLPELQSDAADGGWQAALLPVRHRRSRRENVAAVRRGRRRNRPTDSLECFR